MSNPTGINQYTKVRGMLGKSPASRRKAFSKDPRTFMATYKNERSWGVSRKKAAQTAAIKTSLIVAGMGKSKKK